MGFENSRGRERKDEKVQLKEHAAFQKPQRARRTSSFIHQPARKICLENIQREEHAAFYKPQEIRKTSSSKKYEIEKEARALFYAADKNPVGSNNGTSF